MKLSVTIQIIELVNPKENKQIYQCNFLSMKWKLYWWWINVLYFVSQPASKKIKVKYWEMNNSN